MDYWPSYIPKPSSLSESVDDPYIEATSETGDDSARVRYSKERQGPTKLTWKIMRLGDFVALKQFYADHRAIEFLWLHPSRVLTYKTRFVSSPISSSEDGKSPFVAQVEVTLQIVELAPTEQEQPSASDLMDTINAGADKAVQAAIDAGQARDDAKEYAKKAAASAKEAADTAAEIPAAVEAGIERIEDAGASQISAVNSAGSTQVSKVNSAGTKQTTAVNNAGAAQVSKVNSAGTSQVAAVEDAGSEQVAAVKTEGKAQTAAAKKQADAAAASAEEAAERLAEFKDLGAEAKTLAAGSKATASFDSSTGILTIGVPEGKKGDKGDPGTFLEDGVTVIANASGEAVAKDLAIDGDVSDLASARGFFYDNYVPWYAGTPADTYLITDFNEFTKPGRYHIRWREGTDAEGGVVTQNNPNAGNGGSYWYDGIMEVDQISSCSYVSSYSRLIQRLIVATIYNSQACRIFIRRYINNTSTGGYWEPWKTFTFDSDFGDGLRITNYKISVPEMEGATASANGVSGLVPPPLKADLGKSLGANGEWTYPADVAVGGDVNDLASMRGQIGHARELGDNVDYNTVVEAGFYLINANGSVNAPFAGNAFFLQVFRSKKDTLNKNFYQIAYNYSSARERTFIRQYRTASKDWSPWSEILTSSNTGDGITVNNGIISVPEYEGATTSAAGTSGLVPPAAAGEENFVLHGDGTYRPVTPSLEVLNNFRKSMIGMSFPFPSTTLPEGFVWADGSLILFEDYPEVKEKYEAGGFDGMLLAWDADEETIAANLGKWRPNAATPTGLFVPNWGGQFSRAWVPGQSVDARREAGSFQRDELRAHVHRYGYVGDTGGFHTDPINTVFFYSGDAWATTSTGGSETRSMNIAQPHAIYLGVIK